MDLWEFTLSIIISSYLINLYQLEKNIKSLSYSQRVLSNKYIVLIVCFLLANILLV
jgi:hypothetical protein